MLHRKKSRLPRNTGKSRIPRNTKSSKNDDVDDPRDLKPRRIKPNKRTSNQIEGEIDPSDSSNNGTAALDVDDLEIIRLEKLLSIHSRKGRKAAGAKLNKEYEQFEGIGGGFGDFLMDLDDLSNRISKSSNKTSVKQKSSVSSSDSRVSKKKKLTSKQHADDDNDGEDEGDGHVQQHAKRCRLENNSKIDKHHKDIDDEDKESDNDGIESSVNDDDDNNSDNYNDDNSNDSVDEIDGNNDDDDSDIDEQIEVVADHLTDTYQPVQGEDIYGRITDASKLKADGNAKYVPPSKRRLLLEGADMTSEAASVLKRTMNGLLNRLSDQSKDTITRSIRTLFEVNSLTLANTILKDCLFVVCMKADQTMSTLIPVYAGMIAVLHMTVSKEIGAFLMEHLVQLIIEGLKKQDIHQQPQLQQQNKAISPSLSLSAVQHSLIGSKRLVNYLLILVHFYTLRILHHQLILDIAKRLCHLNDDNDSNNNTNSKSSSSARVQQQHRISEIELELLVCLVEHCGFQLRRDEPSEFKRIIQHAIMNISSNSTTINATPNITSVADNANSSNVNANSDTNSNSSRFHYFSEVLTQAILTGKSQRMSANNNNNNSNTSNRHIDTCLTMRKWTSTMKSQVSVQHGNKSRHLSTTSAHGQLFTADTCLCVSLTDILEVEQRGRWWRAGASWQQQQVLKVGVENGRDNNKRSGSYHNNNDDDDDECSDDSDEEDDENNNTSSTKTSVSSSSTMSTTKKLSTHSAEETALLKIATQMKFNTTTRKNIFLVLMTSTDINDAFERLIRLDLYKQGKEEREIIRVCFECSGQEKLFNLFYCELIKVFCAYNRQFKTTTQFAIWDFMKSLESNIDNNDNGRSGSLSRDNNNRVPKYRIINMARLVTHMIVSFNVSISMIKRVDMSDLSTDMILFLSTLFLTLFLVEMEQEETFEKIFDRAATTTDFQIVRDNIVYFLQNYLKTITLDQIKPFLPLPTASTSANSTTLTAQSSLALIKKRKKLVLHIMDTMDILSVTKQQNELKLQAKQKKRAGKRGGGDGDFDYDREEEDDNQC